MKRVMCLLLSGFLALAGEGPQTARRDGNWWRTVDAPQKAMYVGGFFDGMILGNRFSYFDVREQSCVTKIIDSYDKYAKEFLLTPTNLQVSDGLDRLYDDFRNRSIETPSAIWIVFRQTAGSPQSEVDKLIENSRRSASKPQ